MHGLDDCFGNHVYRSNSGFKGRLTDADEDLLRSVVGDATGLQVFRRLREHFAGPQAARVQELRIDRNPVHVWNSFASLYHSAATPPRRAIMITGHE